MGMFRIIMRGFNVVSCELVCQGTRMILLPLKKKQYLSSTWKVFEDIFLTKRESLGCN